MRGGATILFLSMALAMPAAASADMSVAGGTPFGPIAAEGGLVASVAPAGAGKQRLVLGAFGALAPVPVATARKFEGLDLGTDSAGRQVLVYARCNGRCDLFAYSIATRRERKLTAASRSACTERDPHMVRGGVAFVREARRSESRRLRCAGGVHLQRAGRPPTRVSSTLASALDYDGRLLAYVRERSGPGGEGEVTKAEVRVQRPGGKPRIVATASSEVNRGGTSGTVIGPVALGASQVYWTRLVTDEDALDVADVLRAPAARRGPPTVLDRAGRLWVRASPEGEDPFLSGLAVDSERLFYGYGPTTPLIGQVAGAPLFR